MKRAISFAAAKAQYPHRYTMEHVPVWARKPHFHTERREYVCYAPHYRTDREWYDSTLFPGDDGYPDWQEGGDAYSASGKMTWPLGKGFLKEPFHVNRDQRAA